METRQHSLPVDAVRPALLAALERGPVVLSSPTGSGKSTQVPRWCPGPVLVIEPRRVACRSLAQRVASLEGVRLGGEVGYHVRDERRVTAQTRIVFATPGVVLRLFDELDRFQTVVVDEFHERGLEVDLLFALLLERRRRGESGHLVMMSATLDGEKIAHHIGGEALHAEGRAFPVTIRYLAGRALLPDVRGLEGRLLDALKASAAVDGDVLVFLPGKGEISACERALAGRRDLEVLTLHGGLTLDEQSRIFEPAGRRKVILATNVAETSLTVPGVGVVIDTGLVRQTRYRQGRGFLTLVPVAQDSADQRAGRAGRTAAGTVFRLWSQAAQLETRTAPEVHRESLVPLVLSAAACGADPACLPFLDPPKEHALEAATEELGALGAVDADGALTDRGRRLFGLPLDPFLGRLLIEAEERGDPGLLADMVDLVAVLSVDRPLPTGRPGDDLDAAEPTLEERCDAVVCLRALRRGGESQHPAWREVMSVRRRLLRAFEVKANSEARGVDRQRLAAAVIAADRRVVHVARRRGQRVLWSNGGTEIEVSKKSALVAGGEDLDGIDAVAVLQTLALGLGGRDVRLLATRVMPLPLPWIAGAGLGRDRLDRLALKGESVVAHVERTYAGTVIASREEVPRGELAREAVTKLFLRGRLFPGVRQHSQANFEAVVLALRLASSSREAPYWFHEVARLDPGDVGGFEGWVHQRLDSLGVESGDDVGLLSPDDLLFPPLPDPVFEELDRVWPRTWSFAGVTYQVDYELERSEVILRPRRGTPKELPGAFFLPRFPGLGVQIEHKGTLHRLRRARGARS